jgi:hypothetical protein
MNAQKYLLDNNCDDLILNDRFGMNPTDRIYTSDIMEKYAKDYHESEVNKLKQGAVRCSLYTGTLNEAHAKCERCGKEEWQHKL